MYAHSVGLDTAGNAYVNGHFTSDPVRVKRIARDGTQSSFDLPRHPVLSTAPGGPIPYEMRVAPNGIVWVSELTGNRLVSLNPATKQTRAWEMPPVRRRRAYRPASRGFRQGSRAGGSTRWTGMDGMDG